MKWNLSFRVPDNGGKNSRGEKKVEFQNEKIFNQPKSSGELDSSTTDAQEPSPIVPINKSVEDPTFIDPKEPGAYEKIRQKNIAEREKLFHDLKISQMKTGISHHTSK